MLKKLRLKFIVLNMVIVAVVVAVAFSSICYFSYRQETESVRAALDAALSLASDAVEMRNHDAMSPEEGEGRTAADGGATRIDAPDFGAANENQPAGSGKEDAQDQVPSAQGISPGEDGRDVSAEIDAVGEEGVPPEIGGKKSGPQLQQQIPVATYRMAENGSLQVIASGTTATISSDVLAEAAALLATTGDGAGELESLGLLYEKRTTGKTAYVAFADIAETGNWKKLALILLGAGIIVLAVFFVISVFFSKWALRPVERAWETQTRFVADASHDLKTPLTIILANTSIIRKHPDATVEEMGQWLESTEYEAHEMQALVGDLLLLAQLDEAAGVRGGAAAEHAEMKQVDLSKIAEGEVLQFESIAFESGLSLLEDISENINLVGDAPKLKRLMATLIDNACKYAGSKGVIEVSLRRSADGKSAIFSVHNTGSVISEEDLPYVFDRFYRADKARAADVAEDTVRDRAGAQSALRKSHGLGLAIARSIAEEHQGALTVESGEGKGTTFTAVLPIRER